MADRRSGESEETRNLRSGVRRPIGHPRVGQAALEEPQGELGGVQTVTYPTRAVMDTLPDKPADTPSSAPPPPPDTTPASASAQVVSPPPGPAIQPLSEFLSQSSRLSAPPPPPPLYAPNRVLPRFIRLLALYVFLIGGTVGAATAWFYQSILYPRLVQRLKMMTRLHQHGLVSYQAFSDQLQHLATAKGFTLLAPRHDPASAARSQTDSPEEGLTSSEAQIPDETSGLLNGAELADQAEAEPTAAPVVPAPAILAPFRDSLHQLSNTLQAPPLVNATTVDKQSVFTSLSTSLSALTTLITTQNSASSSMAYSPYIGYNPTGTPTIGQGLSQDQLELKEVVKSLKAEIRTVKGALLNRRNFATLPSRGEAVAA